MEVCARGDQGELFGVGKQCPTSIISSPLSVVDASVPSSINDQRQRRPTRTMLRVLVCTDRIFLNFASRLTATAPMPYSICLTVKYRILGCNLPRVPQNDNQKF